MSNHRVLVQINESDYESKAAPLSLLLKAALLETAMQTRLSEKLCSQKSSQSCVNTELEVLNNKTLLLSTQNRKDILLHSNYYQKLCFDSVGYASDPYIRAEIAGLMNQLLLHNHNCGLIRFEPNRECNFRFLCNTLVADVDKRIHILNANIYSIKLECYEVRKYDIVNVLSEKFQQTMSKKKRNVRSINFKNTIELHKWLHVEYLSLWKSHQGHEWLDVELIFFDSEQCFHRVKLSLFTLYVSKIDSNTKEDLTLYLSNVSESRKTKRSMVVDCIREYFNGEDKWCTLIIFDVPNNQADREVITKMLEIARAAYNGTQALKKMNST